MMKDCVKISVIMSAYNESEAELISSINSILNQTYENIELILIGDNPNNQIIEAVVRSVNDDRLHYYPNEKNMGLVNSLNRALSYVTGQIVARMDADDIAEPDRLAHQYAYMEKQQLDMLGTDLCLINEQGKVIRERMHFPTNESKIRRCMRWGGCMPHPTWMLRRNVYEEMNGYRHIPGCEDYDFLIRVMADGRFRIGNMPEIGLRYRVRSNSISVSGANVQYLVRSYLAKNMKRILSMSENDILKYRNSEQFAKEEKKYCRFLEDKAARNSVISVARLFTTKYTYMLVIERMYEKIRER